jgi:hypothetical protein
VRLTLSKSTAPMAAVENAAEVVAGRENTSGPLLAGCRPSAAPLLAGCNTAPLLAGCGIRAEKSPLLAGCIGDNVGTRALKSK